GPGGLALVGTLKDRGGSDFVAPDYAFGRASILRDGDFLALFDPRLGEPRNVGVSRFLSPPILTPNPVVAGRPVRVTALFEGLAGADPRTITWDWGDGDIGRFGRVKKYASPGTYVVQAAFFDPVTTIETFSAPTTLVVLPAGTPQTDVTRASVRLAFAADG